MTDCRNGPSELLALLDRRWKSEVEHLPEVYRAPTRSREHIDKAARLHASAHHSDPTAYGRIKLHLKRGIADVQEVTTDALARLAALQGQSVGIVFPSVQK